jgi:tetratricopeptide (TPR) repeat protein
MDPLQRLREAALAFRPAAQEEHGWFDRGQPECREGERLLKAGQAAEAEEIFRKAAEDARKSWGQRRHRPRMLLALAAARWRLGKLDEARSSGEEALELLGGDKAVHSWEYGEVCEILSRVAWEAADTQMALERMSCAIAGGKAQRDIDPARLVERQRALGGMLHALDREPEAEAAWRAALEIAEARCGAESAAAADCLMDLCGAAARRGCLDEAKSFGERAVRARRAACGNDSISVAKDLETLAGYCQQHNEFESAVRYLEQSLQVRDRQIGGNTPELASLLMALADVYSLLGRIAPALELMRQAVGKLGPGKDRNFAEAIEKLGAMYHKTGRYEDAAECYARARQFWSGDPLQHADELRSNGQALEQLAALLPAHDSGGGQPAEADPGISVLLPPAAPNAMPPFEPPPPAPEQILWAHPAPGPAEVRAAPSIAPRRPAAASPQSAAAPHPVAAPLPTPVLAGPRWETVDALPISSTPDALPSAALAEPRWEGWEDVEFELLYAEGEERER